MACMESHEGGCLCRAVRYRVTGSPLYTVICHCETCRKAAAAPSMAWITFARENFQILFGTPRGFRSSSGVLRTFCENCGSPLTYASDQRPREIDVTTLSMDDPSLFPPTREIWLEDRITWEALNPERQQFSRGGGE